MGSLQTAAKVLAGGCIHSAGSGARALTCCLKGDSPEPGGVLGCGAAVGLAAAELFPTPPAGLAP